MARLCRVNSFPLCPRRATWIQAKREGVYAKSGRSGAFEPGKLGLSSKAYKCCDAATGDLGVLTSPEPPSKLISLVLPVQPAPDERRHKCEVVVGPE